MAVKIGHAVHSETGGREGASGDQIQQQGKKNEEVQTSTWYVSGDGWGWYIEAKDPELLERMAKMMEQACANPNIGYSRTNRFDWYNSAKANGRDVTKASGDCDCSSLVSGIANLCGANVTNRLATASMLNAFKKSGDFNIYTDADHLETDLFARRGGIYLRVGHTFMVLQNGACAVYPVNEEAEVDPPYIQIKGKVNVRNAGGWTINDKGKKVYNGKVIYTAKDEKLPFEEFDADSGWYGVQSPAGAGFVSCDLPKSAILVES